MKKNLSKLALFMSIFLISFGCSDDTFTDSIFVDPSEGLDPNSASYPLDAWLYDNYLVPFNLDFRYKLQDVGADMDYNLVPTKYDKAVDMALLVKYLWFDAYAAAIDDDFLKMWGPRIIHLIGSPAYNPANGTMILGLAEGGIKVSLFRCNSLDYANIGMLNEYYFKTMHHEFAHILHQTKTYPREFNTISAVYYEPFSWQNRDSRIVASLGFVSPYASSQTREDFVEVIANYIVKDDAEWDSLLKNAAKEWKTVGVNVVETTDSDGIEGDKIILRKLSICRQWLRDAWGVDLDRLRNEVQTRQSNINMVELRKQLDKYKK